MWRVKNHIHTFEKLTPIIQVIEESCSAAFKETYLEWLVGNPLIELTLENKHLMKACREAACLFFTSFPCLFWGGWGGCQILFLCISSCYYSTAPTI